MFINPDYFSQDFKFIQVMRFLLLLVLISGSLYSQDNQIVFGKYDIDSYITNSMSEWKTPGLTICIIKDGKVIKEQAYGLVSMNDTVKINNNTLFMIGSITKTFVATSLLVALNDRKLNVESPIGFFLKNYHTSYTSGLKKTTIRELLSHQTGYQRGQDDFFKFDSNFSNKELIEKVWSLKQKNKKHQFGYNNTGYVVAGEIIETITKENWFDYIKYKILTPLSMNDTGTSLNLFLKSKNKALAHKIENDTLKIIPYSDLKGYASGSIYSTIDDMKKWLMLQMDYGKFLNEEVIDSSLIQETRKPEVLIKENKKGTIVKSEYGMGWYINNYLGTKVIEHTGSLPGFTSIISILPEKNIGYVILSNQSDSNLPLILSYDLINYFSGNSFKNYSNLYKEFFKNKIKHVKKSKMTNDDCTTLSNNIGMYNNEIYGNIELREENNDIVIYFEHHPKMKGVIDGKQGNLFVFKLNSDSLSNAFMTLNGGETKVKTLTLSFSKEFDEHLQTFTFKKI